MKIIINRPNDNLYGMPESTNNSNEMVPLELEVAHRMLGEDFYSDDLLLRAAKFMSGKADPVDEKRMFGKLLYEDDPEYAMLFAFDLDRNEYNRRTLKEVAGLLNTDFAVTKAEAVDEDWKFEVVPGHYSAQSAADAINRATKANQIYKIQLGGKYSGDTRIARDPNNGMLWLIKPGSNSISPAQGINEERASQAQREAAFYAVADAMGLGMAVPKCFLVKLNDVYTAVMPFLPADFKPLSYYKHNDPNKIVFALDKFGKVGMLHMWAIMEWILGSVDSHANNMLMAPDGSIALIDHGSTFSGVDFDPANDDNSFIPYYLRYRVLKGFKKLTPEERLNAMPTVNYRVDNYIQQWLQEIDTSDILNLIKDFGIAPEPVIQRLENLKSCQGSISKYIDQLWATGNPLARTAEANVIKSEIHKELIKGYILDALNSKKD